MKSFKQYLEEANAQPFSLEKYQAKVNKIGFDNKLPIVPIAWYSSRKSMGEFRFAIVKATRAVVKERIVINKRFQLTDESLTGLVAHEMIHQWFVHIGDLDENHGSGFIQKAREVSAKLGVPIELTDDIKNLEVLDNKGKVFDFILAKQGDNWFLRLYKEGILKKNINIPEGERGFNLAPLFRRLVSTGGFTKVIFGKVNTNLNNKYQVKRTVQTAKQVNDIFKLGKITSAENDKLQKDAIVYLKLP